MTDMKGICVSIVLPACNSEKFIADTLASVQNQSHRNWELIVGDDGSTDQTKCIVEEYIRSDSRIRLIQNSTNCGVAETRNRCLQEAQGEYICFIDSDDLWPSDKIEFQLASMLDNQYAITCGHFMDIDEHQTNSRGTVRRCRHDLTLTYLLKNNCVLFQTVMAKADCRPLLQFKNIRHEDFVLAIDLLRAGICIHGLDRVLAYRRRHSGSLSANKWRSALWRVRIYRDYLHFNGFQTTWYTGCYAFYAMMFKTGALWRRLWN